MKSFRDRNPYAVGIVSVLVIGGLTGFAFAVGLLRLLEDSYTIRAEFADAAGLKSGNDVSLAGVKVGRVTGIDVDRESGTVIVSMAIDSGTELHDGTTAEIGLRTLLGAKYIRLDDAMEGEAELEGYCDDAERATSCRDDAFLIPYENAGDRVPFDIFELTRIATEGVEELDTDALNNMIDQLADVTEGRRESLTELITTIDDVSNAVTSRESQLSELIARTDELSATLAEKDDTIVALIDQSRAILALLDTRRDALATALGEGAQAVTDLADLISTNEAALDRLLTNLHPTLDVVRANLEDVNRGLSWVGPGVYNQALAGSHGPFLDVYIRGLGPDILAVLCQTLTPGQPCT